MYFGLDIPTTEEYADSLVLSQLAAEAETSGWDGFFIWDVLNGIDPWIALTAIALHTKHIRIGIMALPLARHMPWLTAKRLADLDHLSNGRIVCTVGLGFQDADFSAYGANPDPRVRATQLDEGLTLLHQLWTDSTVSYCGQHYVLTNVTITPKPVQSPRIPLWVAGGWPHRAPFRRAAQWDGICFMSVNADTKEWLSVDEFRAGLTYVQQHRRTQTHFDVIMAGDTSGDQDEAIEKVQIYSNAGATWWIEEGLGWSLSEFRDHIKRGPPRR